MMGTLWVSRPPKRRRRLLRPPPGPRRRGGRQHPPALREVHGRPAQRYQGAFAPTGATDQGGRRGLDPHLVSAVCSAVEGLTQSYGAAAFFWMLGSATIISGFRGFGPSRSGRRPGAATCRGGCLVRPSLRSRLYSVQPALHGYSDVKKL
jgi:hypothetical protein